MGNRSNLLRDLGDDRNLDWLTTINREIFATEIIRTMIGSIGLVLAVPITTCLAVLMLIKPRQGDSGEVDQEEAAAEARALDQAHVGHHH